MSIESYIRAMPKVELHLHLEGSIQPEILLQLAAKNNVDLPHTTVEGLREWYQFSDFDHFIDIYIIICSTLRKPEDFERITYDLAQTLAAQNCRYAEITWTPGTHARDYAHYLELFAGLRAGQKRALDDFGIEIRWIPDISRQRSAEFAEEVAAWVSTPESMAQDVVALGLGGPEVGNPPEKFIRAAEIALANGLPINPHAGETVGVESIWGAINALHALRIKHGIRAVEDPELVKYMAENNILIEVCPTSNLCLGVYETYADYPLKYLASAGIPFTVSSDDPPMFNTTLTEEYLHIVQDCGLNLEQLEESVLIGIRFSYLPDAHKTRLENEFVAEFAELRQIHL